LATIQDIQGLFRASYVQREYVP